MTPDEQKLSEQILKLSISAIKRTTHYLQLHRAVNFRLKNEKLQRELDSGETEKKGAKVK